MADLIVRAPMFHSPGDEGAFFGWLKKNHAVRSVLNRRSDLVISLRDGRISADEVRELRALFHRYGMDTSDLEALKG